MLRRGSDFVLVRGKIVLILSADGDFVKILLGKGNDALFSVGRQGFCKIFPFVKGND